jgi:LEA14-like dessication related protein
VTVADIRPLDVTLLEQRFGVKVRVLNPNDADIEFDGVVFDLELNGKPFAKGVSNQRGTIPRFGEALIDVNVVSGLSGILRQVNALRSGRETMTYRLTGRLAGGAFGSVPFETQGELKLFGPAGRP